MLSGRISSIWLVVAFVVFLIFYYQPESTEVVEVNYPSLAGFGTGHEHLKLDRAPKYYREPGEGEIYGHYDLRYYGGEPLELNVKREALRHLIQAYLEIFRDLGLETWLAHGTLLGWWWNGRILPWDGDIDVQVSLPTLITMAENYNFTTHSYTFVADNGETVTREYLLDVNPNWLRRVVGNWNNVIDARFVDTETALFIDITALTEFNPRKLPSIWACKVYHMYHTVDLYPMRRSTFEGVPALIPHKFENILTEEYGPKAITDTLWEGWRWHQDRQEWMRDDSTSANVDSGDVSKVAKRQ